MSDSCPYGKCGGLGFINVPGTNTCVTCQCRRDLEPLVKYQKAGIPKDYLDATFADFSPKPEFPEHVRALAGLRAYAASWPERQRRGDGAAILSPVVQVGKSHLAIATMRDIIDRYQQAWDDEYFALFVNLSTWAKKWSEFWSAWPVDMPPALKYGEEWQRCNHELRHEDQRMHGVQLLVLDDLGERTPSESLVNRLYEIVEWRTARAMPIIVTGNMLWDAMVRKYGDESRRIVDRIRARAVDHTFIIEGQMPRKRKGGKR